MARPFLQAACQLKIISACLNGPVHPQVHRTSNLCHSLHPSTDAVNNCQCEIHLLAATVDSVGEI